MKSRSLLPAWFALLLGLCFFVLPTAGQTQEKKDESSTATAPKTLSTSMTSRSGLTGLLTEEEIGKLQAEWTDPKSGSKFLFSAYFSARQLSATTDKKDISKYSKSGKIPYRVTATLYETKEVKGKKVSQLQSGKVSFYILDSAGQAVEKRTETLDKMCPS